MKRLSPVVFVASILFSIALIGSCILSAGAQEITNSEITNALFSPTSSQRFFQRGRVMFDVEIQRWLQQSQTPSPILQVDPNFWQQQQARQEQQEQLLEEMMRERNDRTPFRE
jgi:hypothetical protein